MHLPSHGLSSPLKMLKTRIPLGVPTRNHRREYVRVQPKVSNAPENLFPDNQADARVCGKVGVETDEYERA